MRLATTAASFWTFASIDASVDAIDTITASEAAEKLGVSRARTSQMVKAGILEGYTKGNASFITCESVQRRLNSKPRPGRPRLTKPKTVQKRTASAEK